jgi:uncharacterized protein (DUF924 family)
VHKEIMSSRSAAEPNWVSETLHCWFDELGKARWFARSDHTDALIRERFLGLHQRLVADDGVDYVSGRSLLAAVIVLDQFSRNLFRDTPAAYAADPIARRLARNAIARGFADAMTAQECLFLYLPFEHSEDRADQALAVQLIARLGNAEWTRDALAHQAIIDRFGRFPHRNAILNRSSSADEVERLQQREEWF